VKHLQIAADNLVERLLSLPESDAVCILDSCGVGHLGSHLLIAGVRPTERREITNYDAAESFRVFDAMLERPTTASIFTLSYDLALKLHAIPHDEAKYAGTSEPDIFIATFGVLIVHDYRSDNTFITGDQSQFAEIESVLAAERLPRKLSGPSTVSNESRSTSRADYVASVEIIKEHIRAGLTYQTNLTQQMVVQLSDGRVSQDVFASLRGQHPAPFAAFLRRPSSDVVSASPERFFKIVYGPEGDIITASPTKGTRRRGQTDLEDARLRSELTSSEKDRAENTMIVDLTRNDLGRICQLGSVRVENLCELEEHPTLFHLVSTVTGRLVNDLRPSHIIRALFPCGSITGAPKLSTMRIIESIEPVPRGLSMGSIGCFIPHGFEGLEPCYEMNVAIRTTVIREGFVTFNVGGGIVYDSNPDAEYDESLLKAKALLTACGASDNSK